MLNDELKIGGYYFGFILITISFLNFMKKIWDHLDNIFNNWIINW